MNGLLQLRQLRVDIGGKTICSAFDLEINQGESWAILGKNGSGKTTLLHTLAGLYSAESGEILLHGQSITSLSRKQIARQLGLLLQDYEDHFPGTVLELVVSGRHPWLSAWQWESDNDLALAKQALSQVDLAGFANRQLTSLSGGERRRVALAMLLTQSPEIYLLDEPTNHLDIHHQHRTLQLINELVTQQQKTAIMVLHDMNLAMRYCDHALFLFEDAPPLAGKIDEVMTVENLSQLLGHPLVEVAGPHGKVFLPA